MPNSWINLTRQSFTCHLERLLQQSFLLPPLSQAMSYSMLNGGKRVRPLLCLAAASDFSVQSDDVYDVAAAIEAVHVYSLVHDDLPCMDDDILRRGQPTCHVAYNEPTALLVGDALQSLAFEWLAELTVLPTAKIKQIQLLAKAIGVCGMAGGQQLDLEEENNNHTTLEHLEKIHRMKTGSLIEASILMGAVMSPVGLLEQDEKALREFGKALGLAFQVIDDILDVTADTAVLGKTAGKDAAQDKATYVKLLGVNKAKQYAEQLNNEASIALEKCSCPTPRLLELQHWLLARQF